MPAAPAGRPPQGAGPAGACDQAAGQALQPGRRAAGAVLGAAARTSWWCPPQLRLAPLRRFAGVLARLCACISTRQLTLWPCPCPDLHPLPFCAAPQRRGGPAELRERAGAAAQAAARGRGRVRGPQCRLHTGGAACPAARIIHPMPLTAPASCSITCRLYSAVQAGWRRSARGAAPPTSGYHGRARNASSGGERKR